MPAKNAIATAQKTEALAIREPGFTRQAVLELSHLKGEPEWVHQRRLEAWEAYEATPMPQWRRTSLRELKLDSFIPFLPPEEETTDGTQLPEGLRHLLQQEGERTGLLIHRNSTSFVLELDEELAAQGVILTDLDTAVREYPELVEPHLMKAVPFTEGKFEALHSALWSGGTFLYVPEGVYIEKPIRAIYWVDAPSLAVFPHTLIVAGPNSGVTYLEERVSPEAETAILVSSVVEVHTKPGAQVHFLGLQDWGRNVFDFTTRRAVTDNDSVANWVVGYLGGKLNKEYLETQLAGPGSSTEILGVFFVDDRQHLNVYTKMNHVAPFTSGDLLFRGALQDAAHSVFEGMIKIHPGAQDTASYLHDNTLLLSDDAHADSIPSLEIEANQVRASHGATMGKLDAEQLFYLMAHGLPEKEAIRLLVTGFFEPIIERIPLEGMRERLRDAVAQKAT